MTMSRTPGSNRRRPKRQRTPTTLYTDDNPSTFTTKVPKSERIGPEVKPPKPSYYFVEEDVIESPDTIKRSIRKRKPYHKDDMLERTTAERLEDISQKRVLEDQSVAAPAIAAVAPIAPITPSAPPPAPPVKRKRGRPPKNRSPQPPAPAPTQSPPPVPSTGDVPMADSSTINGRPAASAPAAAPTTQSPMLSKSGRRPRSRSSISKPVPAPEHSWTPPSQDAEGTFFNHAVRMAPILPSQISSTPSLDNTTSSVATSNHSSSAPSDDAINGSLGRKFNKIAAIDTPKWTPLYQPDVYFDEDYDAETNKLPEDLEPVTRSITCMTTRKPDHRYMAVGDSMGFCTIYTLGTFIRPVARLETLACQQRARTEQERVREQQKKKRKSLVVDTSETMIHALEMIEDRVVIATSVELECIDIPSQMSLWVCPLGQDRLVRSIDVHPQRHDVLVSCTVDASMYGMISPLMLLQQSSNNDLEVCDPNAPMLMQSPSCTAIWDASRDVEGRLLFVVVKEDELELVLVQGPTIDTWKVSCKTRIPVKQSNYYTRLSQSQQGLYTLVACSRGIRLYQTETLQLIHVYGDQLALHGKSIVWHDCLLMGKHLPSKWFSKCNDSSANVECDNWLQAVSECDQSIGQDSNEKTDSDDLGQYVIGVPSYKGAKELTETLHIWKVESASVVPAMSIPLPQKSEGVQSLVVVPSKRPGGDRLVLASRDGTAHSLLPKMISNFAGIMYPPGYELLTDNAEYVEEEDELDVVATHEKQENEIVDDEEADVDVLNGEDELDDDLREALRQSILEQKRERERKSMEDKYVDVVLDEDQKALVDPFPVSCRPEAYLRQAIYARNNDSDDEAVEETETGELTGNDSNAVGGTTDTKAPRVISNPKLFVANILESLGHTNPKKKEGGGEFSFSVTAKVVISSAPIVSQGVTGRAVVAARQGKRSRATNLEAMLKSSIDPKLQRFMISKQAQAVSGKGSSLRSTSKPATQEAATKAVTPSPSVTSATSTAGLFTLPNAENGAPKADARFSSLAVSTSGGRSNDEAAVVLGLLGLSPAHSQSPTPDNEFASDTASRTSSQTPNQFMNGRTDPDSELPNGSQVQCTAVNPKQFVMDPTCFACRGRFVIHTCGRRALPIDYDEVAKQEREKQEREEEEKKRMRAEKRRLADQKRREARKIRQLELEEQRRREDDIRAQNHQARQMEQTASLFQTAAAAPDSLTAVKNAIDAERQRREMIVASYASHLSHSTDPPFPSAPVPATTQAIRGLGPAPSTLNPSLNYSQRSEQSAVAATTAANTDTSQNGMRWERLVPTVSVAPTPTPAPVTTAGYTNQTSSASQNQAEDKQQSMSMATLSSADALVALASFAGTKSMQPETTATTNGHVAQPATAFVSYTQSPAGGQVSGHGFGTAALPVSSAPASTNVAAPARASIASIPTFEAIRNQVSSHEAATSAVSATKHKSVAHSFLNYEQVKPAHSSTTAALVPGSTLENGTGNHHIPATTSYVWPSHPGAQ